MFQVAISRLREIFPLAKIVTFSKRPDLLHEFFLDIDTIGVEGRDFWYSFKELLDPLPRLVPQILSDLFLHVGKRVRIRYPYLFIRLCNLRGKVFGHKYLISQSLGFIDSILKSDLVVVTGMGGIHDSHGGAKRTLKLLDILEMAIIHQVPIVLLGQGIGPIDDHTLLARAKQVLPRVNLIAVREKKASLPLLLSLGVDHRKIEITGDDAIELAYGIRRVELGDAIGVGIRLADASQIQNQEFSTIKKSLQSVARSLGVRILPIPIMNDGAIKDSDAIKRLLEGFDDLSDGGASLSTPRQVIHNISQCRVVVAGSYHASVFALAQGVPSIGLAKTNYYKNKLRGVSAMFGNQCEVLSLDDRQLEEKLAEAITQAWYDAERLRPSLLEFAGSQIKMGRQAYSQIATLVSL
jgi:colanic acid/amylovoran biosynthesis protein